MSIGEDTKWSAANKETDMSRGKIVVGYDFSDTAALALREAVEIVWREPSNMLHVVTVIESHENYQTADRVREDLLERLRAIFEVRGPGGVFDFFVHARLGRPADEILGVASDVSADLIVVGSHGHGPLGRLVLGSVSDRVLHGARCPVLIVRPKDYVPVVLEKVIEVVPEGFHHPRAHAYSYTGSNIVTRPKTASWGF